MPVKHYDRFKSEDMVLRDHLAVDRTILANERTFLAFIRTALTLFIGGISFIKFFDLFLLKVIGWVFVPLGILILLIGIKKYFRIKKDLQRLKY